MPRNQTDRVPPAPDFLKAGELSRQMGISLTTVSNLIRRGAMPPPWTCPSPYIRLWRTDHYQTFVKTGRWPDEAFKHFKRGKD